MDADQLKHFRRLKKKIDEKNLSNQKKVDEVNKEIADAVEERKQADAVVIKNKKEMTKNNIDVWARKIKEAQEACDSECVEIRNKFNFFTGSCEFLGLLNSDTVLTESAFIKIREYALNETKTVRKRPADSQNPEDDYEQ